MSECLPDLPRYVRQRDGEWQGADHPDGPWRPIPAPQSGLPWPVPPAAQPIPLSPAAQAILKAFDDRYELLGPLEDDWQEQCLAAALNAVGDQVAPEPPLCEPGDSPILQGVWMERRGIRAEILAIAAELEGQS